MRLWHFVAYFALSADLPEYCCDAKDYRRHDGRVRLPIMWLRIPATWESPLSAISAFCRALKASDLPDGDQTCLG
jgi:hypothetical protein